MRTITLGLQLYCTRHMTELQSTGMEYNGNQIVVNVETCKKCLQDSRSDGYDRGQIDERETSFKRGDPGHPDNDMGM